MVFLGAVLGAVIVRFYLTQRLAYLTTNTAAGGQTIGSVRSRLSIATTNLARVVFFGSFAMFLVVVSVELFLVR